MDFSLALFLWYPDSKQTADPALWRAGRDSEILHGYYGASKDEMKTANVCEPLYYWWGGWGSNPRPTD